MEIAEIQARPRLERGTRACKRLRAQGLLPAVIYGRGEPNVLLSLRRGTVETLLEDRTFIVQVGWDGQQESAQLKEVQYDALGDKVVHVDLVRISLTETITVSVRVELHGEAAGAAEGGVLDLRRHELEVECLPAAIPERLRVEVASLAIGDDLRIADIEFPEGVQPVEDPDTVVVVVLPPAQVEEEEAEAGLEGILAEPEVIGREPAAEAPKEEAAGREPPPDAEE